MKVLTILLTSTIALLFNLNGVQAQNGTADSIRRVQQATKQIKLSPAGQKGQQWNYYKRTLKLDSVTAEKVAKIQDDYKAGMKAVESDQSLNIETRKTRIKALMEEKNRQLEALLDAEQQRKIIPPGEPRSKAETNHSRTN